MVEIDKPDNLEKTERLNIKNNKVFVNHEMWFDFLFSG
jgi:hypothetical protein